MNVVQSCGHVCHGMTLPRKVEWWMVLIHRMTAFVVTALPAVTAAQQSPPTPSRVLEGTAHQSLAFVNVSVIPMDRERVLERQTVLIQNDKVVVIGPTDEVKVPDEAVRIDGTGKFLIPGLSDMHTHLQQVEVPDSVQLAETRRGLLDYLATGVTTIRNMDGRPWHLILRDQAGKGELLSPRIYSAGPTVRDLTITPDSIKRIVAAQKAAGYDFYKMYLYSDGNPEKYDQEVLDTFAAVAKRMDFPFAGHTPFGNDALKWMLRNHAKSIEHLLGYAYIVHGLGNNLNMISYMAPGMPRFAEADLPALAAETRRAGVWNCPMTALIATINPDPDVQRAVPVIIRALRDAGAGLLSGTDGEPGGAHIERELRALHNAGLTPYQALETSTRNVALFFGTLDSTGTVEVGKRADLVLLRGNPLDDIQQVGSVAGVVLGGRWLSSAFFESAHGP